MPSQQIIDTFALQQMAFESFRLVEKNRNKVKDAKQRYVEAVRAHLKACLGRLPTADEMERAVWG